MSVNRVVLVGRLTRDPELRETTSGHKVANFSIAVNRRFKREDKEADFFRVSCWGQTAEFVSNYLHKGRLVSVDGRLEQRQWQAQDGSNRESIDVVADNVEGLDRPREDGGGAPVSAGHTDSSASDDEFDPFAE